LAVVVATVAVLLAGCGGDGGGEQQASSTVDGPSSTAAVAGTKMSAGGGGDYCKVLTDQALQLGSNDQGQTFLKEAQEHGMSPDAAVRTEYWTKVKARNAAQLEAAPNSIHADVEATVRVKDAQADAFIKGDYAGGVANLRDPAYVAATQRVARYAEDTCGLKATSEG
jgi:hypothetical protein